MQCRQNLKKSLFFRFLGFLIRIYIKKIFYQIKAFFFINIVFFFVLLHKICTHILKSGLSKNTPSPLFPRLWCLGLHKLKSGHRTRVRFKGVRTAFSVWTSSHVLPFLDIYFITLVWLSWTFSTKPDFFSIFFTWKIYLGHTK